MNKSIKFLGFEKSWNRSIEDAILEKKPKSFTFQIINPLPGHGLINVPKGHNQKNRKKMETHRLKDYYFIKYMNPKELEVYRRDLEYKKSQPYESIPMSKLEDPSNDEEGFTGISSNPYRPTYQKTQTIGSSTKSSRT